VFEISHFYFSIEKKCFYIFNLGVIESHIFLSNFYSPPCVTNVIVWLDGRML